MQCLFESWSQAAEDWKKSTVYVSVCEKTGTIRRGVRKWVTKAQLVQSVGVEVAEAIITKKGLAKSSEERKSELTLMLRRALRPGRL